MPSEKQGDIFAAIGQHFRAGANEGGAPWKYFNPIDPGGSKIRTMPLGSKGGAVGRFLGRLAYAGEGPQHRIQYQDVQGQWHDVPQGWDPSLDPETMQPLGDGMAGEMLSPDPLTGGEDEDFQALLGASE